MFQGAVGKRVRDWVRQTCEAFEIQIISGVVNKDHVHIFVSALATIAPSEIMRRIKGRSASKLFEELPHIKKRYWGRHFFGQKVISVCVTSGEVTDEMTQNYLKHHFEPGPNDKFKIDH